MVHEIKAEHGLAPPKTISTLVAQWNEDHSTNHSVAWVPIGCPKFNAMDGVWGNVKNYARSCCATTTSSKELLLLLEEFLRDYPTEKAEFYVKAAMGRVEVVAEITLDRDEGGGDHTAPL